MPLINQMVEKQVYMIISEELKELGCPVRIVNGMPDHIHCLFLLNPQKSIAEIIKQVKGSTSYYINKNNLVIEKFAWQTGYAAYSISESMVDKVFQYIQNQKKHHIKKSFKEEHDEFLKLYRLNPNK